MLKTQFEKAELLSIPVDALFSTFEVLSCLDIPNSRLGICILEGKVGFCKGAIVSRCCEDEEGKAGMFECAMARLSVGTTTFSFF